MNGVFSKKFLACLTALCALAILAAMTVSWPSCLAADAGAAAVSAPADAHFEAVTTPCKDVQLSFPSPGRIAKVLVSEGDIVKIGDLLAQQDDVVEQIALKSQKIQADDETRIKAAVAQMNQKKVDRDKYQEAFKVKAATQFELDHAELDVTIADLSLELEKIKRQTDKLKYEEMQAHIDKMKLQSSVAGKVEKIMAREGEWAEGQVKAMRIVCIDPLWIEVAVPQSACEGKCVGVEASVLFPKEKQPVAGKIVHVASVGDPQSDTVIVKVEVPNPSLRRAGERVKVSFPAMGPAANTDKTPTTKAVSTTNQN